MILLPALLLPLLFAVAVYRLGTIPLRLMRGALRLPAHRRLLWSCAATLGYTLLLGATLGLAWLLVRAFFFSADPLSAYLAVAGYALAYPLIYMAAAWIFFHALKPAPGSAAGR